jgi:P27 family predicted phage terminase small subunit
MARPRLSDEHHKLVGTTAHKSVAKTVSKLAATRPKMPSHLSKAAKAEWKKILPQLLERGSLTEADACALSLYCETKSRWIAAKADVEQNGLTITVTVLDSHGTPVSTRKTNPSLRTLENCERSLRGFLREFGMTPATRERVLPVKKQENDKPKSAAEILFGKKG